MTLDCGLYSENHSEDRVAVFVGVGDNPLILCGYHNSRLDYDKTTLLLKLKEQDKKIEQ